MPMLGSSMATCKRGTIRAEKFIEHLARVAHSRKNQGSGRDLFERDVAALRKRISWS